MLSKVTDVVIIGSNLGGSLLANILAKNNISVIMVDPSPHPKFSIGEATTPDTSCKFKIISKKYDIPEINNLSNFNDLSSYVGSQHGIKKSFSFLYHREGSVHCPNESHQFPTPDNGVLGPDCHFFRQDTDAYIYNSAIKYGIYLDDEEHFKSGGDWYNQKKYELSKYYENTYFETFCNCDLDEKDGRIFLCEKNAKPILQGQPFIWLSNINTLESIRSMGFETYPELFDESYDNEVDIKERFNMVVTEIERYIDMWNKNKSEVHQIFSQDSILEKRKHNQNWLMYHNPVLPELNDKLSRVII